jgi:hypothetical protein
MNLANAIRLGVAVAICYGLAQLGPVAVGYLRATTAASAVIHGTATLGDRQRRLDEQERAAGSK